MERLKLFLYTPRSQPYLFQSKTKWQSIQSVTLVYWSKLVGVFALCVAMLHDYTLELDGVAIVQVTTWSWGLCFWWGKETFNLHLQTTGPDNYRECADSCSLSRVAMGSNGQNCQKKKKKINLLILNLLFVHKLDSQCPPVILLGLNASSPNAFQDSESGSLSIKPSLRLTCFGMMYWCGFILNTCTAWSMFVF